MSITHTILSKLEKSEDFFKFRKKDIQEVSVGYQSNDRDNKQARYRVLHNSIIACDTCLGLNPSKWFALNITDANDLCPGCGSEDIHYIDIINGKLFGFIQKNFY